MKLGEHFKSIYKLNSNNLSGFVINYKFEVHPQIIPYKCNVKRLFIVVLYKVAQC